MQDGLEALSTLFTSPSAPHASAREKLLAQEGSRVKQPIDWSAARTSFISLAVAFVEAGQELKGSTIAKTIRIITSEMQNYPNDELANVASSFLHSYSARYLGSTAASDISSRQIIACLRGIEPIFKYLGPVHVSDFLVSLAETTYQSRLMEDKHYYPNLRPFIAAAIAYVSKPACPTSVSLSTAKLACSILTSSHEDLFELIQSQKPSPSYFIHLLYPMCLELGSRALLPGSSLTLRIRSVFRRILDLACLACEPFAGELHLITACQVIKAAVLCGHGHIGQLDEAWTSISNALRSAFENTTGVVFLQQLQKDTTAMPAIGIKEHCLWSILDFFTSYPSALLLHIEPFLQNRLSGLRAFSYQSSAAGNSSALQSSSAPVVPTSAASTVSKASSHMRFPTGSSGKATNERLSGDLRRLGPFDHYGDATPINQTATLPKFSAHLGKHAKIRHLGITETPSTEGMQSNGSNHNLPNGAYESKTPTSQPPTEVSRRMINYTLKSILRLQARYGDKRLLDDIVLCALDDMEVVSEGYLDRIRSPARALQILDEETTGLISDLAL